MRMCVHMAKMYIIKEMSLEKYTQPKSKKYTSIGRT